MSKSIKNEQTRPYLDRLAVQRKERQERRDMKAAFLNDVQEMLLSPPVFAQDFE